MASWVGGGELFSVIILGVYYSSAVHVWLMHSLLHSHHFHNIFWICQGSPSLSRVLKSFFSCFLSPTHCSVQFSKCRQVSCWAQSPLDLQTSSCGLCCVRIVIKVSQENRKTNLSFSVLFCFVFFFTTHVQGFLHVLDGKSKIQAKQPMKSFPTTSWHNNLLCLSKSLSQQHHAGCVPLHSQGHWGGSDGSHRSWPYSSWNNSHNSFLNG